MCKRNVAEMNIAFLQIATWPGDSSVGVATSYELHGLGIESRLGRDFLHLSRLPLESTCKWVPGPSQG